MLGNKMNCNFFPLFGVRDDKNIRYIDLGQFKTALVCLLSLGISAT